MCASCEVGALLCQRVEDGGRSSLVETGRRFHSMDHTSTHAIAEVGREIHIDLVTMNTFSLISDEQF